MFMVYKLQQVRASERLEIESKATLIGVSILGSLTAVNSGLLGINRAYRKLCPHGWLVFPASVSTLSCMSVHTIRWPRG